MDFGYVFGFWIGWLNMSKCNYCGKKLEDDRYDYCNIYCRKEMKLSKPKQRVGVPIMEQNPEFHQNNYFVQKHGGLC